ncbi:MAG: hypothetical protein WKF75_06745 [Singulisphaera sp.]
MRAVPPRELTLNRRLFATAGVIALACLLPGCGSNEPPPADANTDVAGPTRRLMSSKRFQDPAFKKLMEKGRGELVAGHEQ